MPIFTPKISHDLFLVIDLFSDFPLFTVIKCSIRPFLHRKNHYFRKEFLNSLIRQFFTLFILSHTSDNIASLNIGGTNAWAIPHLKFWGDHPHGPGRFWTSASGRIPANTEYSRIFAGVMSSEYLPEIFREYSLNIATLIRIFANIRSGNVQRIFTKNIQGMFFVLCPANIYEKYAENIP